MALNLFQIRSFNVQGIDFENTAKLVYDGRLHPTETGAMKELADLLKFRTLGGNESIGSDEVFVLSTYIENSKDATDDIIKPKFCYDLVSSRFLTTGTLEFLRSRFDTSSDEVSAADLISNQIDALMADGIFRFSEETIIRRTGLTEDSVHEELHKLGYHQRF